MLTTCLTPVTLWAPWTLKAKTFNSCSTNPVTALATYLEMVSFLSRLWKQRKPLHFQMWFGIRFLQNRCLLFSRTMNCSQFGQSGSQFLRCPPPLREQHQQKLPSLRFERIFPPWPMLDMLDEIRVLILSSLLAVPQPTEHWEKPEAFKFMGPSTKNILPHTL